MQAAMIPVATIGDEFRRVRESARHHRSLGSMVIRILSAWGCAQLAVDRSMSHA